MKKLLLGTFLLFYAAISVMLIVEHTSSWASTYATASKASSEITPHAPHAAQKRIVEYPVAILLNAATSALREVDSHSSRASSKGFASDLNLATFSRAPPTLL